MAATKQSKNGVYLPADLVNEILLKLPIKSIVRFNCVAKNWYHLFKNPTFVSEHNFMLSKKNSAPSLIINYRDEIDDGKIGLMMFGDDKTFVSYHDLHQQLPCHVADNIKDFNLAVWDGLVCLYNFKNCNFTVWNPATREFRILPDCNFNNNPPREDSKFVQHHVGFGIDPLSNDYKVLCIRVEHIDYELMIYHYAIYRMSSDSWRVLKKEELQLVKDPLLISNSSNVCVSGVCYWQVLESLSSGKCKLLKFNLGTEVFQLMDSPIPGNTYGDLMPLTDGRIALWDSYTMNNACAVWVLNLNHQGNYWTNKLITIDVPAGIERMYGFWTHGKVFVESSLSGQALYDLKTREVNDLGIYGIHPSHHMVYMYTYKESLLGCSKIAS
ncbi:hypothetical protein COLO4_23737 [Corchorus olitorius]|uniref:F-box domain-containing protein n=1 Tax=Corchorus olitorius TaxID=93759 RepID=A0A1R3IF27_9ROSI|nr:hypothetical protein COLO4_23737 [Corchorus olitorius]